MKKGALDLTVWPPAIHVLADRPLLHEQWGQQENR